MRPSTYFLNWHLQYPECDSNMLEECIGSFRKAVELMPENPNFKFDLAVALLHSVRQFQKPVWTEGSSLMEEALKDPNVYLKVQSFLKVQIL